jgi:hypothetical protein
MNKSPAELEAEIEASRQALARDLDALKDKAAPRKLVREAARKTGVRIRRAGAGLLGRARSNPIPVAVIGGAAAGVAWLLARRRHGRSQRLAPSSR